RVVVSLSCCLSYFFFSSRRRHTRSKRDWSSDVCSSDLNSSVPSVAGSIVKSLEDNKQVELHTIGASATSQCVKALASARGILARSEERRVGKECRCRWSQCEEKNERKEERSVSEVERIQ